VPELETTEEQQDQDEDLVGDNERLANDNQPAPFNPVCNRSTQQRSKYQWYSHY
jgi:hypothetical protein